jgi:hypothetical protein
MATRIGLVLTATLFAAGCYLPRSVTIDEVVGTHTEARGGAASIESVDALRLELLITEPGFSVEGRYVATREGYMRIDIFAGGERVFTEALGPDGGWHLRQGEKTPAPLSPEGERALRRGLERNLYGLHELPGLGYELALAPDDAAGHWVVVETGPAGLTRKLHIDRATGLIAAAAETKALHPDVDPTEIRQETRFSGWQEHGGVLIVTDSVTRDLATGEVISRVQVTAVEVNPAVDVAHFRAPVPPEAG